MNPNLKKWASVVERLLRAFIVAFTGVYVAGGLSIATFSDASVLEKAADAGLAALGSLILSLLGTASGNTATPSLLPAKLDPASEPTADMAAAVNEDGHLDPAQLQAYAASVEKLGADNRVAFGAHFAQPTEPTGVVHPKAEISVDAEQVPTWTDIYDPTANISAAADYSEPIRFAEYYRAFPLRSLGRVVRHDERSRRYAIPELPREAIQSQHWARAVPIFDQGQVGSCTGNAAAGWLATADANRPGLTVLADGTPVDEKLALSIYSAAETIDGDGPYPPNDNGSSGLSVAQVLKTRGLCDAYSHAFSIDAVYSALQTGPGLLGIPWFNSMFTPHSDGRIPVSVASGEAGGHEIVVSRLDVDTTSTVQKIWIDNSWGPSWGINGSGYFTPADLKLLLSKQGDFTVPVISAPTPTPTPTPAPAGTAVTIILDTKTQAKVAKNAPAHGMSEATYLLWLVQGALKTRG